MGPAKGTRGPERGLEEAQHAAGRLTARERVEVLLDPESLRPLGAGHRGALVAGHGTVHGRPAAVYAYGGAEWDRSFAAAQATAVCAAVAYALRRRVPLLGVLDTPGIHADAGPASLAAQARVLRALARAAGPIARIALVAGPCPGAAALSAPLSDLVFLVRGTSFAWLTGPEVARAVAQEAISPEALGGAQVHAARSGLADGVFDHEIEALLLLRRLLGFLPAGRRRGAPAWVARDPATRREPALARLLAADPAGPADMREMVLKVVDEAQLFELQAEFAPNLITGLARMAGVPVGVLANQPAVLAGCLDRAALAKATRFVRLCDRFYIPVLAFVDAPGFLPGSGEEHGGIARAAAELVQVFASARVSVVRVIPRRAWGGPALAMGLGSVGTTLAWPQAEIGLLDAASAAELMWTEKNGSLSRSSSAQRYRERVASLRAARAAGLVDEVVEPPRTREHICRALGRPVGARAAQRTLCR